MVREEAIAQGFDPRMVDELYKDARMEFIRKGTGIRPKVVDFTAEEEDGVSYLTASAIPGGGQVVRIRRVTGYLSTEDRFNRGKRAELHDREIHHLRSL